MTRTIHRTYDSWKTASPDDEWQSDDDRPERDPDAEYDAWRDEQMQKEPEICPKCGGFGGREWLYGNAWGFDTCKVCNGNGVIECEEIK